jgi:hypothetical protein
MPDNLPTPIDRYVTAMNSFDVDGLLSTFVADALVNDVQREFWGTDSIRRWAEKEIIGDKVTVSITEVKEHHGGRPSANHRRRATVERRAQALAHAVVVLGLVQDLLLGLWLGANDVEDADHDDHNPRSF